MFPGTSHTELYKSHDRFWQDYDYVYPVLSRRSRGISVGVNITPAGECNFRCVYCQVDQGLTRKLPAYDLRKLRDELETCTAWALSGAIFEHEIFRGVPEPLRRVNDIAFSGDGEPTLSPIFAEAVDIAASVRLSLMEHGETEKIRLAASEMKLVLITNATRFRQPAVRAVLTKLMANHGEIWAKLDAGTEAYYKKIDRSAVSFSEILAGLTEISWEYPIVLQTLFCRLAGSPPPPSEISAYICRLQEILAAGGKIDHIQLHSVCRRTAEADCTALDAETLAEIAGRIHAETGVEVRVF